MKRLPLLAVLVVVACSKPASAPPPVMPSEPVASPPVAPAAPVPTLPPQADATPDVVVQGPAAERDAELAKRAAGFIDAFTNSVPVPTRDGKRVAFISNRDGLPQLYIAGVGKPDAPATRLLTTTERVGSIVMLPDGKSLVFQTDTGADEQWSFFRVGLDGKNLVELTPGEKLERDEAFIPDGAKDKLFFSARKLSEPGSAVYALALATPATPAKQIYKSDKPMFLADVDSAGTHALALQFPSRAENYVDVVDVASGKDQRLFPTAQGAKVSVFDAKYSADGKLVYIATDGGADQALVLALDAKTGKELARHAVAPPTAQIQSVLVAKRGGAIAVSLLVGNHAEIRILDNKKLAPKSTVKLPLGNGNATDFTEDGKKLAIQWSTPDAPTDIHLVDVATGAVAPLRKEPRPSLQLPKIATSSVDIPAFDGGKIPSNVYVAAGEEAKPHPVIVVYHGGPAGVSTIRWSAQNAYFVSLGYAVVEPNVRGSSGYGRTFEAADNGEKRLDAFKDIETSARWVAKQPWADKDRLVVFGGSYGGYTTLIALSHWPELWRAGVDLFGVVNMKTFMASTTGLIHQLFLLEFGDPDKDAAFFTTISPSTHVGKIVDPTFVYAGANDPRVPRTESDLIVKALRQHSIPVEYMVADNEGHSLSRRENQLAFFARCARFLETHLR
jgi:dipeptidyl aminopeptidase/acylaminoacyl peptidase